MHETPPTEIANSAIANAVLSAVQEQPEIEQEALSALAVKVALAINAGFAAANSVVGPSAPGR